MVTAFVYQSKYADQFTSSTVGFLLKEAGICWIRVSQKNFREYGVQELRESSVNTRVVTAFVYQSKYGDQITSSIVCFC